MNPPPAQSLFQPYLLARERILWTGCPRQGIAFYPSDLFMVPFSIFWLATVIWMFDGIVSGEDGFDFIFLIFIAVGLYAVVGRLVHDAWVRRSLSYAVTDQRILFRRGSTMSSLDLNHLPMLELSERGDGTGSIRFEKAQSLIDAARTNNMSYWVPSLAATHQFFRIANPRAVYELIRRQRAG